MSAEIGVKAATGRVGVPISLMRLSTPLQKQTEEGVRAPAVVLLRAAGPDDEPSPLLVRGVTVRQALAPFSCLTIYPPPITSWRGLGHAQACKPEHDPLQFTRDRRLAAQHSLELRGRLDQLVGLAHSEMLARL